jgi:hypothetical protein
MGDLADRLSGMAPERRLYTLQTLSRHLFEAGPSNYVRLRQLVTEREWFEAQRTFDRSHRTYAADLDLALQASEADEAGLPGLLVISLLRTTLNALAAKMPTHALETMVLTGTAESARYYASQRADPTARCEALGWVALTQAHRGDVKEALETLRSTKEAALAIPEPLGQVEGLCAVALGYLKADQLATAVENLEQASALIPSIPDKRRQTHAQANVAIAARELEVSILWEQAVQAIKAAYKRAARTTPTAHRALSSGNIEAFAKSAPWDVAVFAREFNLLDRPDYLIALAEWDQTRDSHLLDVQHEIPAVVLRTAAAFHDRVIIETIVQKAIVEQSENRFKRLAKISPPLIEALAKIGHVDAAITLVSHHLIEDPDSIWLREALARGAGKRGDLDAIVRAAAPIEPAGQPEHWGEHLWRLGQSIGHALKRGSWQALGLGDVERLSVLFAGYETLARYHPATAEVLWERITDEGGRSWQRLIRERMGQVNPEKRTKLRYLDRMLALARWMPGDESELGDILQGDIDRLVFVGNFERALEVVGQMHDPDNQSKALWQIAEGLLERGQIEQAVQIAEGIPNSATRQRVLDAAAEAAALLPDEQATGIIPLLVAQSDWLSPEEILAHSPALPALMAVYLQFAPVEDALILIEPLGPEAILASLPALSEAAARQENPGIAPNLITLAEKQAPSRAGVEALAAMAANWARGDEWSESAAVAYRIAKDRARRLLPFDQSELLPTLAQAARALADRSELQALFKQARARKKDADIFPSPTIDRVLVQIAAGLTATGDTLKHTYEPGYPIIKEIRDAHHKALAWGEMAVELDRVPPEQLFPRKWGDLLDDAVEVIFDKIEENLSSGQPRHRKSSRSSASTRGTRSRRYRPIPVSQPQRHSHL